VETSCALADAKDTQIGQSLRPVQHAMALPATNRTSTGDGDISWGDICQRKLGSNLPSYG